ncbi:MAG: DUF504 domain-containing protein [Deltaproteobacteria bacterium]|nr:DUF504 domain-containing protein [Deltaproteobacteria bacterium]
MTPIHELLHRIRHDLDFADARFELGYYDRLEDEIIRIGLADLRQSEGAFSIQDEQGRWQTVPLHRVRRVWRNEELIWSRDP